jgi:3-phosphoglycerate kinase
MLERAQKVTWRGPYTYIEYPRFADDVVILVDAYAQHDWLTALARPANSPAFPSARMRF